VGHGSVDLYVDGFRETHAPGEFFLGDVVGLDEIVVGQDCEGVRLSGEVQRAGLYDYALSDSQIKRLYEVEPIETDALFDRGYCGSASYRIPSLLTLTSGTVLAGADQRVSNANDSPNDINFVVRRSLDAGRSWEPASTVIDCPGIGEDASSVIDSCMVQDPHTGRVHVLIDHFPGGIGQPNCWASTGFDEQGRRLLRDLDDARYVVDPDGAVTTIEGQDTEFRVLDDGTLPDRRGSLNIDDEGNPTQRNVLIEDGMLKGYLQDSLNARLMKVPVTGNGRRESFAHLPMPRMTNTFMLGGKHEPEEILASLERGLYAVNFGGGQVDITNGKFVFSASEAYWVENGKIQYPVKGATIIGNGPDALTRVTMIGNDMSLDPGIGVCGKDGQSVPVGVGQPTLRIEGLTVGGTA